MCSVMVVCRSMAETNTKRRGGGRDTRPTRQRNYIFKDKARHALAAQELISTQCALPIFTKSTAYELVIKRLNGLNRNLKVFFSYVMIEQTLLK